MKKTKKFLLLLVYVLIFQNVALADSVYDFNYKIVNNKSYKIINEQIRPIYNNELDFYQNSVNLYSNDELEAKYLSEYITPVKDQKTSGDCWAFATCGAMETAVLKKEGKTAESIEDTEKYKYDFSENHVKYMTSSKYNSPNGFDIDVGMGGIVPMINSYLLFDNGCVLDSYAPHTLTDIKEDYGITANYPSTGYIASEIINIPDISSEDKKGYNENKKALFNKLKKCIKEYGAVFLGMYATGKETKTFYSLIGDKERIKGYHKVLLVGWDDDYPKENFGTTQPDGDGAFIIKNSWGTARGDNGLFYISYYDYYAWEEMSCITDVRKKSDDEILNTYTGGGDEAFISIDKCSEYYFGNIFKKNYEDEKLKSVLLYLCTGQEYTVSVVFSDVESIDNSKVEFSSDFVEQELFTVQSPDYVGYYTYELENPIVIPTEYYSIKIHVKSYYDNTLFPVEYPTIVEFEEKDQEGQTITVNRTMKNISSEPMQSFWGIYDNGIYDDLYLRSIRDSDNNQYHYNFEINAITTSELSKSKIDYMSIVDTSNQRKTSFTKGENIKIAPVVEGVNLQGKELLCCVYDSEKRLVKLFEKPIGNKDNVFTYESIPENFENYKIRAFVFDSLNNITPLGNVKIYGN